MVPKAVLIYVSGQGVDLWLAPRRDFRCLNARGLLKGAMLKLGVPALVSVLDPRLYFAVSVFAPPLLPYN